MDFIKIVFANAKMQMVFFSFIQCSQLQSSCRCCFCFVLLSIYIVAALQLIFSNFIRSSLWQFTGEHFYWFFTAIKKQHFIREATNRTHNKCSLCVCVCKHQCFIDIKYSLSDELYGSKLVLINFFFTFVERKKKFIHYDGRFLKINIYLKSGIVIGMPFIRLTAYFCIRKQRFSERQQNVYQSGIEYYPHYESNLIVVLVIAIMD